MCILQPALPYGSEQLNDAFRDKPGCPDGLREQGFTVLELLISTLIAAVLFGALLTQYFSASGVARDHQIRIATQVQAQAIIQNIVSELRMLGNGVPFDQANFQIGEDTLADPSVTEPIDVSTASATNITFRLNETGEVYLLTADFDPAASLVISLTSITGLDVADPVYISNSVVSGDDGLFGTIAAIDSANSTITLNADYIASPSATFAMGSICEEVPLVTYNSAEDGSGITRDSGFGAILLGEQSTMTLEYLDHDGNPLTLPISNADVINTLRSIRVTVTLRSSSLLKSGQPYEATVTQTAGIRNLNYFF